MSDDARAARPRKNADRPRELDWPAQVDSRSKGRPDYVDFAERVTSGITVDVQPDSPPAETDEDPPDR